jgi:hypothetical protein
MSNTIYFSANHASVVPMIQASSLGLIAPPLGYIDTPNQGNALPENVIWCADNGRFSMKAWTEARWWSFLKKNAHRAHDCAFATAPDVVHQVSTGKFTKKGKEIFIPVGDMKATLELSRKWFLPIRELGYKVALVSQDGWDEIADEIPWDEFDAVFIGGSDAHKLGSEGARVIAQAKAHGKWVHVGRVNSAKRMRIVEALGADSADGTYVTTGARKGGANINLPKMLSWFMPVKDVNTLLAAFGYEWVDTYSESGKHYDAVVAVAA